MKCKNCIVGVDKANAWSGGDGIVDFDQLRFIKQDSDTPPDIFFRYCPVCGNQNVRIISKVGKSRTIFSFIKEG